MMWYGTSGSMNLAWLTPAKGDGSSSPAQAYVSSPGWSALLRGGCSLFPPRGLRMLSASFAIHG